MTKYDPPAQALGISQLIMTMSLLMWNEDADLQQILRPFP
jgi:hypothetical protein